MDAQRWVNMVFGAKIEGLPRAFGPARGVVEVIHFVW